MAVFDFIKDAPARGQTEDKRLAQIPIQRIQPNPNQPRHTFDEESIAELAQSIRQVGLIQPLIVRRAGDHYELVAGERRLRACKSLGMEDVTCIVQASVEEEASAMMALIENLQREDLYFLEEAQCYYTLLTTYDLTQEELAQRLGKSQSSIANKLRVLRLPSSVKAAMKEQGLTERHARALLKLKNEKEQLAVVRKVAEKGLSVKETQEVRRALREAGAEMKVYKNNIVKLALENAGMPNVDDMLAGTCAYVFYEKDPVDAAKVIKEQSEKLKKMEFVGAIADGKALSAEEAKAYADLPNRDQLMAMLAGLINGFARDIAVCVKEVPAGLARSVNAVSEQKQAA